MTRHPSRLVLVLALVVGLLGIAPPEQERATVEVTTSTSTSAMEDYDPDRAGHPLRIVAYALHPVGVILDYVLFRPAYWLASHEPLRTLVGFDD